MGKFHIVYPPFVDAYIMSEDSSLESFKEDMLSNACQWGTLSIGEQVIRTGEPQSLDGLIVVQCGEFDGDKYVAVIEPDNGKYWFNRIKIIKSDFPREWNVT